jgi:tRNA pseudouridine32 synthase/23S rRNA pseudouridine746 synthase
VAYEILFASDFLMVVDKPAGWLTTPARLSDDPRRCLGRELQKQFAQPIFPVHRLDFEVSGLTLWAKDSESHRRAQQWFETSQIRKVYHALSLAGGAPPPLEASEWVSHLVRGKKRTFAAEHGKLSRTQARVLGVEQGFWRWELVALTGRPHQLRYEMKAHGYPLLGDQLYGGRPVAKPHWIALRAVQLSLLNIPASERLGLPETCHASDLQLPDLHSAEQGVK